MRDTTTLLVYRPFQRTLLLRTPPPSIRALLEWPVFIKNNFNLIPKKYVQNCFHNFYTSLFKYNLKHKLSLFHCNFKSLANEIRWPLFNEIWYFLVTFLSAGATRVFFYSYRPQCSIENTSLRIPYKTLVSNFRDFLNQVNSDCKDAVNVYILFGI